MKEFRKTENGLFVCEECQRTFLYKKTLSYHINKCHIVKEYYDKFLNDSNNICMCGKENVFQNLKIGYKNGCCREHIIKRASINKNKKMLNNYGVICNSQRDVSKTSFIKTCIKKYGVKNVFQSKFIKEKIKQTCLEKYGVEYSLQANDIKNKSRKTCLLKYGVEHPNQNKNIFNKGLKTRFLIHKYKDTNLTYQGSYELDFLEKYFDKFLIENGPSIKYQYNGKNKVYHPDFYIPSLNLIVEIKSSWTIKCDIEIEEKKKATIANGFEYLMILNKDYSLFP